jgi:hypothetical protein
MKIVRYPDMALFALKIRKDGVIQKAAPEDRR